jgi:hypothetical protein
VTATQFVEGRCARGEVKVLAQLQDNATDEEFVNYWKEAPEIAVDAFKSEFAPEKVAKAEDDDEADQRPKPKGKKGGNGFLPDTDVSVRVMFEEPWPTQSPRHRHC